jgi:beta-glucosidase
MEEHSMTPTMQEGDFDTICQKLDFYGLNFYNGLYDNAGELAAASKSEAAGGNYQDRPEAHLEAVRDVLHMLVEDYHLDIPIYITENGVPQDSSDDVEAMLDDQERIDYVSEVLRWVHQAIEEGIDVRGYYLWSLMDNFEWSAGFAARYGTYYTDYKTLKCTPKKSALWYRSVIENNGF